MVNIDSNKLSPEVTKKYSVISNTFVITPKKDIKDRIEVEVGDTKDLSTFHPQVKIKRWDNEVNASFRLIDDEPKTLTTQGNKIKLIGAKKEVHFYDIAPNQTHKEGGYELEVILNEKPVSNEVKFSIRTKGLEFFYQPPLTPKEISEGGERPENVVGSYAVY